jgi:hypothetical protein
VLKKTSASLKTSASKETRTAIEAGPLRLLIRRDGSGYSSSAETSVEFDSWTGRIALRMLYDHSQAGKPILETLQTFFGELSSERRCQRPGCNNLISASRCLTASFHRLEPKWCSTRCRKTEAARRFRARNAKHYHADPTLLCGRSDCRKPIPDERQIAALRHHIAIRWCSKICANKNRRTI